MSGQGNNTEIAIIGSGAAGCYFAAKLAASGYKVNVFEAGPARTIHDLASSQIWARRLKWAGPFVESEGAPRFGHNLNMGWGFGGAALHHYAQWPRLMESDFKNASLYGRGLDWPLEYNDLQLHYDEIQAEVGISGDASQEAHRGPGADYPMPPLKTFAGGRIVAKGFEKLGNHVFPTPIAATSVLYKNRPPCIYDGWCDAGCPIGSLANPLVTYLPEAEKAGAQFHPNCDVRYFETDQDGRVNALVYSDPEGRLNRVGAQTFVLAAGAIHNVRLLLSSQGRNGSALGNENDLVGKYFGSHFIANTHGVFEEETEPYMGLSTGALMSYDRWAPDTDNPFGTVAWGIGPAVKPNDFMGIAIAKSELFGQALDAFMRKATHHIALANGICETEFIRESRIELTGEKDAQGRPVARMVYKASDEAFAMWRNAIEKGVAAMRAAGAEDAWASSNPAIAHALGGTIMGDDPALSVTDSYGRLHSAPNLVVAGSSLFPSGGAAGPTFTILALARRTVLKLLDEPEAFQ
ncbi:GMC oxidoreductase [Hyphococcus sp.]|uniref:GMC oxidoreductase n=1 Tax=Hyphococcus sp. TaxID=2038636 RepID=UPI003CCBF7BB